MARTRVDEVATGSARDVVVAGQSAEKVSTRSVRAVLTVDCDVLDRSQGTRIQGKVGEAGRNPGGRAQHLDIAESTVAIAVSRRGHGTCERYAVSTGIGSDIHAVHVADGHTG